MPQGSPRTGASRPAWPGPRSVASVSGGRRERCLLRDLRRHRMSIREGTSGYGKAARLAQLGLSAVWPCPRHGHGREGRKEPCASYLQNIYTRPQVSGHKAAVTRLPQPGMGGTSAAPIGTPHTSTRRRLHGDLRIGEPGSHNVINPAPHGRAWICRSPHSQLRGACEVVQRRSSCSARSHPDPLASYAQIFGRDPPPAHGQPGRSRSATSLPAYGSNSWAAPSVTN